MNESVKDVVILMKDSYSEYFRYPKCLVLDSSGHRKSLCQRPGRHYEAAFDVVERFTGGSPVKWIPYQHSEQAFDIVANNPHKMFFLGNYPVAVASNDR